MIHDVSPALDKSASSETGNGLSAALTGMAVSEKYFMILLADDLFHNAEMLLPNGFLNEKWNGYVFPSFVLAVKSSNISSMYGIDQSEMPTYAHTLFLSARLSMDMNFSLGKFPFLHMARQKA